MSRTLLFVAAVALAAPAAAATYAGKPAAPASDGKYVARNVVWTLSDGSYIGRTDESRPLVLCQSLAKRAGRLESFTVNGRPIADADLAKCNAAAPAAGAAELAEAK
jgi:hypothetical protein